jgi:hypothetical protein
VRKAGNLYQRLKALDPDEFEWQSITVEQELKDQCCGLGDVAEIVAFMEDHTQIDFGSPGPLTHFIETFHGKGYETIIVESVERHPTHHTLWLLRRVINSTCSVTERGKFEALHAAAEKFLD